MTTDKPHVKHDRKYLTVVFKVPMDAAERFGTGQASETDVDVFVDSMWRSVRAALFKLGKYRPRGVGRPRQGGDIRGAGGGDAA